MNKKEKSKLDVNGGTVEIGYAGDWDFDDFTRELTRIETNYLGKTGEMDYYTFLAVLSHIRNVYEKYHKSDGLNNFEKKALIEEARKQVKDRIAEESHNLVNMTDANLTERHKEIYNESLWVDEGGVVENRTIAPKISQEARKAFVDAAKNGGVERVMEYFELKLSNKVDRENFLKDLGTLMNNYGIDTICNVPDFILADTLLDTIYFIEKLQGRTNKWFGRNSEIGKQ